MADQKNITLINKILSSQKIPRVIDKVEKLDSSTFLVHVVKQSADLTSQMQARFKSVKYYNNFFLLCEDGKRGFLRFHPETPIEKKD